MLLRFLAPKVMDCPERIIAYDVGDRDENDHPNDLTPNPPQYFLDNLFFVFGVHSDGLFDLLDKCPKHILASEAFASIEAERVFVQVHLQYFALTL